jgi:REP element-mobilizing transposase RayT
LVTTNTHARLPLFRDATLATVVLQNLEFYRERLDFSLNAFVVMPDHLHLLLIPRETWLSDIMRSLKSFSAKQIIDAVGTQGPIWQSRFHDRAIRSEDQFLAAIEYIHQNPVIRICVRWLGRRRGAFCNLPRRVKAGALSHDKNRHCGFESLQPNQPSAANIPHPP